MFLSLKTKLSGPVLDSDLEIDKGKSLGLALIKY